MFPGVPVYVLEQGSGTGLNQSIFLLFQFRSNIDM